MNDLWAEIQETQGLLDLALAESKRRGNEMVVAEARYYTAKSTAAFALLEDKKPVSFINTVIKGLPTVSDAMSAYHKAEVEYKNSNEAILVYKKRIDVLREQYAREWSQAGSL